MKNEFNSQRVKQNKGSIKNLTGLYFSMSC